jgi:hypothetical protein
MKLEVGKTYRNREGQHVKIIEKKKSGSLYPFRGDDNGRYSHTGVFSIHGATFRDNLVEEVADEEPTNEPTTMKLEQGKRYRTADGGVAIINRPGVAGTTCDWVGSVITRNGHAFDGHWKDDGTPAYNWHETRIVGEMPEVETADSLRNAFWDAADKMFFEKPDPDKEAPAPSAASHPESVPHHVSGAEYITFRDNTPEGSLRQVADWLEHNASEFLDDDMDLVISLSPGQDGFLASFAN